MSSLFQSDTSVEVIQPPIVLPGCRVEKYQSRAAWLSARGIGSSDAPGILGVGYADDSPLTIWGRKTGRLKEREDSQGLWIGRKLEGVILEMFAEMSGYKVTSLGEYTLCRSHEFEWLTASPDSVVIETEEGDAIAEAKNVSGFLASDWADDDQPLKFQVQTQELLAVTGLNVAYSIGLIGGNKLKWVKSYRNDKFISLMIPKLAEFQHLVDEQIEPEADASEATRKAIHRLHPLDNGVTIDLPEEANDWHREIGDMQKELDWFDGEIKLRLNRMRQAIGDNTFGLLGNGKKYSYKYSEKTTTCKNCQHQHKSEPFRTLRSPK